MTLQNRFFPQSVTVEVGQVLEFKSENHNLQHRVEVSTKSPVPETIFTSQPLKTNDVCRVVFTAVGNFTVVDPVYSFMERGIVKVIEGGEVRKRPHKARKNC